MRLGWVSGPPALLGFLNLHMQASSLHTSNLSQMLAYGLLTHWGEEGLQKHLQEVRAFYRSQRDAFHRLATKHLQGLAEWSVPKAGMFVWMRLLGIRDSKKLIEEHARDRKVLLVPGQAFSPGGETSSFVRASYSTATEEEVPRSLFSHPPPSLSFSLALLSCVISFSLIFISLSLIFISQNLSWHGGCRWTRAWRGWRSC